MAKYLIANIPIGEGLYGNANQANIPPGGLIIADGISLAEGGFRKEGGSTRYATALATGLKIIGGTDWHPVDGSHRMIISANNGKVYRATGSATGVFSEIATGLNTSISQTVFVEAGAEQIGENRKLFLFTGYHSPRYIDGDATSLATMTTPPSDWSDTASGAPVFGSNHFGRLFAGGNANDPHRLYYSTASDHLVTDGTLAIYPGEGHKLVGAASFKGYLVCWKYPTGIYYVDSTDPSISNWRVERLTNSVGLANPLAFCVIENDIIFLDATGDFNLLSIVDANSKEASNITKIAHMAEWFNNNVNISSLTNARMVYYPHRREVHCALAGTGSIVNNLRVIIDLNNEKPRYRTSYKDTCESLWISQDDAGHDQLSSGDDQGGVWILDQSARSKDGSGFNAEFRTAYSDLSYTDPSLSVIEKNFHWLELLVNPTGNYTLSITIHIDGEATQTVDFNMGTIGAALGTFELDTDQLGGSYVLSKKKRLTGSGREISISGTNSGNNEDFDVSRILLHFTPGSSRLAQ